MDIKDIDMNGLSEEEVTKLQAIYGKNELTKEKKENLVIRILHTALEPMFLLLLVSSVIYFLLGEPKDGLVMLVFITGMITIDLIQELKTDKTLKALKTLSSPKIAVIRNGKEQSIDSTNLVPGDIMLIHEGDKVPADGFVIKCAGLMIDESTLTGEAEHVRKKIFNKDNEEEYFRHDYCYAGTLVTSGTGIIYVDKIGATTEYGNIGESLKEAKAEKTPLETQTDRLVKICAVIALILFIIVGIVTFLNIPDHKLKARLIESILSGVTLAMAMIPEEFPVVLTVFLSMGAWRLAKKKSLVKKLSSVETLGAVSVLCVDKTGTITKNKMEVKEVYTKDLEKLNKLLVLASLENAYDPMEKAMFKYANEQGISKEELFSNKLIKEYAFFDNTKMMANVWQKDKRIVLAAKGSPESIIDICNCDKDKLLKEVNNLSKQGLRVIAVAKKEYESKEELPKNLEDETLEFIGLVGLIDPPKDSVEKDIKLCYKAGIRLVMITGDNGITASAIAKSIGMKNCDNIITGKEIDNLSDDELRKKVKDVSIFSRVIPKHKMRIVKAFKERGEIVAMTGDGVNDAPALKYADIGIAMGKRGSEVSREAADLILLDDNFTTIVDTVKDGRRIYDNIKRAIKYIFTIHIPIAGASLLAPILGIEPACLLFLPVHVVIMELIIDPTSSIVLERVPAENNVMDRKPRNKYENLVNYKDILSSILQGLIVFIMSFALYYYVLKYTNNTPETARCMGLLTIVIGNIFLVQVNSSSIDSAIISIKKLAKDKVMLLTNLVILLFIGIITYTPVSHFLKLDHLTIRQLLMVILTAFISTFWYEIVKLIKRIRKA